MSRNGTQSENSLQQEIRKQFGSTGTTRFVRSLPAFQVKDDLPDRFSNLLDELDRAEGDSDYSDSDRSRMNGGNA